MDTRRTTGVRIFDAEARQAWAKESPQHLVPWFAGEELVPTVIERAVTDLQWFVAMTGVRQELKAADGLAEAGYARFLPLAKRAELPGVNRRRPRYRPVFPRYVFFGFSRYGTYASPIADVEGISGILAASGKWLQVPPQYMQPLMMADAYGLFDEKDSIRKAVAVRKGTRRRPGSKNRNHRAIQRRKARRAAQAMKGWLVKYGAAA